MRVFILKKFIFSVFAALFICIPAFAMEAAVPEFDVYINSERIEKNTDYPVLLYKNITYFPMTYNYVR